MKFKYSRKNSFVYLVLSLLALLGLAYFYYEIQYTDLIDIPLLLFSIVILFFSLSAIVYYQINFGGSVEVNLHGISYKSTYISWQDVKQVVKVNSKGIDPFVPKFINSWLKGQSYYLVIVSLEDRRLKIGSNLNNIEDLIQLIQINVGDKYQTENC